jgi:hypothetical protein
MVLRGVRFGLLALIVSAGSAAAGECTPAMQDWSPGFIKGLPSTLSHVDPFDPEKQKITKRWDLRNILDKSRTWDKANKVEGSTALRLTVDHGDMAEEGDQKDRCSERAEITELGNLMPATGADLWYGFRFYVPKNLPPIDRRLVLAQMKQLKDKPYPSEPGDAPGFVAGNPVMAFRLRQLPHSDIFCFSLTPGNEDALHKKHIGIVQLTKSAAGGWHSVAIHVRVVPTKAAESRIDMWWDGSRVERIAGYPREIAIGYHRAEKLTYFKMGPYRDQKNPSDPDEVDQPWSFTYDIFQRYVATPQEFAAGKTFEGRVTTPPVPPVPLGDNARCARELPGLS